MIRFSMSSSPKSFFVRSSPQANSLCILVGIDNSDDAVESGYAMAVEFGFKRWNGADSLCNGRRFAYAACFDYDIVKFLSSDDFG